MLNPLLKYKGTQYMSLTVHRSPFIVYRSPLTCSQWELGNLFFHSVEQYSHINLTISEHLKQMKQTPSGKSVICNINPKYHRGYQIKRGLISIGFKKIASYYGDGGGLVEVMFWTSRPVEKKRRVKSPK